MVEVQGIIIPVEWDENGNVDAVVVSTYDEEEYLIDNQGKGEALLAHLREELEVSGELREERGIKIIKVKKYKRKRR